MKLFVTGGTGFIGSHFVNQAIANRHRVVAIRRPDSQPRIPLEAEPRWIEKPLADLDPADLEGCEAFVHFAAVGVSPQKASWESCFQMNVMDSLHAWRLAVTAGVRRFILCGSCFEYGASGENLQTIPPDCPLQPTAPYHASKAAASMAAIGLCRSEKLHCSILRPFHAYGEGEEEYRFWPSLRHAALSGEDFPMTFGEQVRDFIPVEQVASAFLHALEKEPPLTGIPEIKNIGTGKPQTLREFAEFWWSHWGATGKLQFGAVPYRPDEVMRYVPELIL